MKIVRFAHEEKLVYGALQEGGVKICSGDLTNGFHADGKFLASVPTILLPVDATKMIAIWGNSWPLQNSRNAPGTKELCYIIKPPSSFIGHKETILLPASSERVIFEAELAFIVKRRCKNVKTEDAADHIAGWVAVNDVTAQDVIRRDPSFEQYSRAKGFDTFGVIGPVMETALDLSQVRIQCFRNEKLMQDFGIDDFIRGPYQILAELSADMTLEAGDIVACGSSLGVAPMSHGDVVRVEVSGVGKLENPVAR